MAQTGEAIANYVQKEIDYVSSTPLSQQIKDAASPQSIENVVTVAAGITAGTAVKSAVKTIGNISKSAKTTVYRVYGGDSQAAGYSWTPINPNSVANYRGVAGLPSGGESGVINTGRLVIEGTVKNKYILQRHPAQALDGHPGGLMEYIIDPNKVNINRVSGANPQF